VVLEVELAVCSLGHKIDWLITGMEALEQQTGIKRIASTSSMAGMGLSNYGSIYNNVWRVMQLLSTDPSPLVTDMARRLVSRIKQKVRTCKY